MNALRIRLWRYLGVSLLAAGLAGCQQQAGAQSAAPQGSPAAPPPSSTSAGESTIMLSGKEEVPPVSTSGAGTSMIRIAPDRTVSGKVTFSGVNATAAHIHLGARGSNGPPIVPLAKSTDSTFVVPAGARLTEEQYAQYQAGNLYINIHSDRHPNGELRAQLPPR